MSKAEQTIKYTGHCRFGFIFVPGFNLASAAMSIEVLRVANRLSSRELYTWKTLSETGEEVQGSNNLIVKPDFSLDTKEAFDFVVVCASFNAERGQTPKMKTFLRAAAYAGKYLGAIGTGSYILANAGLLDGHRCTIHWENRPAFAELYPHLDVTENLYEIDRKRITCGGASASLDVFLQIVAAQQGSELALDVADQMLVERIRNAEDHQKRASLHSAELSSKILADAVRFIDSTIERPVAISRLAQKLSISQRQLERLFHKQFSLSPSEYYTKARLDRARTLIGETTLPISEIMVACGFGSQSNFSRVYRQHFGMSPSEHRRKIISPVQL